MNTTLFPDAELRRSAIISGCRLYRYDLWRKWGDGPFCLFIGLNPSTADAMNDDPTIRRCIDFAKRWGYDALCMMNLFAYRATQPRDMKAAADPIGPENDTLLRFTARDAGIIIAAWGNDGRHLGRDQQVMAMLPPIHCLKINDNGTPGHPLYIPADTVPKPYQPQQTGGE